MRLTKTALVAAACALTALNVHAQVRPVTVLNPTETYAVDTLVYNPAGGGTIAVTAGATLTLFSEYATTVDAAFVENGDTDGANLAPIDGVVFKVDPVTGLPTGGNVVKQGGGVLQINSWTGLAGTQRRGLAWWTDADGTLGYDDPFTRFSHFVGADSVSDLQPSVTGDADGRNGTRLNGLQGTFTIDQGTVRLAGFLNVWHDQGDNDTIDQAPLGPPPRYTIENVDQAPLLSPRMTGVSAIILNGSSVLELTNSPLNVPTGASNVVTQGNALRVQYLRNLQAGLDAGTGAEHDQLQTELVVGTTAEYRALVHIDQGRTGSIGILAGAGDIVKSGAGDFLVINESRLTGNVTVAGGRLILDSAEGRALASAASVSLAGAIELTDLSGAAETAASTGSRRGAHVRYLEQDIDVVGDPADEVLYKPAYAPAPGTRLLASSTDPDTGAVTWTETLSGAELEIRGDQVIRNFQSNFALAAAPDATGTAASAIQRAADVTNRGELVIAGTGRGASVILGGHSLTVRQDKGRDGLYEGKILSGFEYGATLADEGAGSYLLAFDALPDFGTFQLRVTGAEDGAAPRLTAATDVTSAEEIRSNIASALGIAPAAVTVTDVSALTGDALAWRVDVGASGTLDAALNLRAGKLILDATSADAKLALNLEESTFGEIETRAGSLIVNAVGLGNARVNVSSGELRLFQNDTGSLEASILGGGTLRVVAFAEIDNGSGTPIQINSAGTRGTLNFAQQQLGFTGELVVNDGVDVSLSAVGGPGAIVDTLANASAITLDGQGGLGSTLRFNDTDQLVRNLSGDAVSEVDLGRGTMTLVQADGSRRFLGEITGVGSILKEGSADFAFRGVDALGVAGSDFTGALAVRKGSVSLATADTLRSVSGVALAAGTSLSSSGTSQTLGALFGEAGSSVNLGAATLSVGFTPAQLATFRQQLETSFGFQLTLAHNYLGTTENAYQLLRFTPPLAGAARLLEASDLDRTPLNITVGEEIDFLVGDLGLADQTRLYLERVLYRIDRDGDGAISSEEEALAAASAATLGYAGSIIATGADQSVAFGGESVVAKVALSKTGWETLRLLGSTNQLGGAAVVVRQGILEAAPAALATAGSVVVLANSATLDLDGDGDSDADLALGGVDVNNDGAFDDADRVVDGTLALLVESGTVDWSLPILGDGNLRKTGAGTLRLASSSALHTGLTDIQGGTLELTLVRASADPAILDATLGSVTVAADATLALRTDAATSGAGTDFAYVAPDGIAGAGTLAKLGRGTLSIDGLLVAVTGGTRVDAVTGDPLAALSLDVREGTLRFTGELPSGGVIGRSAIASGATLALDLDAGDIATLSAELTGAGTLRRTGGGALALDTDPTFAPPATTGSLGFTGTLELAGGDTSIENAGAFANAKVSVLGAGTTLTLRAGNYQFAGLTGEAGTIFALDPATVLTLDVTTPVGALAPRLDTFLGQFTGGGDLTKTGDGILSLAPAAANDLGDITVSTGTLRATVDGLGSAANLTVASGAFLEFNVASGTEDYSVAIGGAGSVSKFGDGTLRLLGANGLPAGDLRVLGGTLVLDDQRVGGGIPAASVASGATLEILLNGDRTLASQVTGAGNLAFDGAGVSRTVTLLNAPTHDGLVSLKRLASLAFDAAVGDVTLGGLAAEAGSTVTLNAAQTLTLDQTSDGDFEGAFAGSGDLVIRGTGVFAYKSNDGDLSSFAGSVTIDGGKLQVGVDNTKAIALADGSTLLIDVATGDTAAYAGALDVTSGTASLVKVGDGTLDLTAGIPRDLLSVGTIDTLTVTAGKVLAGVVDGAILDGADIILASGGSLAVSVGALDTVSITETITSVGTGGAFEKTGDGRLILVKGTATADITVTAGILQLGLAGAPASAGSDILVAAGATLSGSGTVAGGVDVLGTLAPGFSPGTLTVAGDLAFGAGSTYDAEILGGASDLINFGGALSVDPAATLRLTGAAPIGARHTLLSGGTVPVGGWIGQRLTAKTGDAETPLAYVLETVPGSGGRIDAVVVRGSLTGNPSAPLVSPSQAAGVSPAFLSQLADLARVEVDPATGVVTDQTVGTLGRRLAGLSETSAPSAVKSLTAVPYLAGAGMAHLSAAADNETLARRTEQRRYDRGYMSVKSREFFVSATSGAWDADDAPTSPGYDISRTGMLVGWDRDLGPQAVAGLALSLDRSEAKLVTGGQVEATQYRLHAFGSTLLTDDATFLEGGAFVGHSSMDASRGSLALGASGSPSAFVAGAWFRVGRAALIAPGTSVVPFAQLDVSHASQGAFAEAGEGDAAATKLAVADISQTDVRGRLGFSLAHAWDTDAGGWRYRLSLDVAYVDALADTTVDTSATGAAFGTVAASADPLDQGGLLVTPALTFGPDHDNTFGVSAELRQLDGGSATSLNLTYRRRF